MKFSTATISRRLIAAVTTAACFLGSTAFAFTVVKDVNSGKPPKPIMVIFDKAAKDAKSFKPTDRKNNVEFAFADDGALQIKIAKKGASEVLFPFPQVMDISKTSKILFTCKLEGQQRTSWQGKWNQWDPYNGAKLWWGFFTNDSDGRRSAGSSNLDSCSPDGFIPKEMKTIEMPTMFFARRGTEDRADPSKTAVLQLNIGSIRDTADREYTLTIEKIIVAE